MIYEKLMQETNELIFRDNLSKYEGKPTLNFLIPSTFSRATALTEIGIQEGIKRGVLSDATAQIVILLGSAKPSHAQQENTEVKFCYPF